MKKNIHKNVMGLEMRSEEGRCAIAVDLSFLSRAERIFLFGLLQSAQKGAEIAFGVAPTDDGSAKVVSFTIKDPMAPSVATSVHNAIKANGNGAA